MRQEMWKKPAVQTWKKKNNVKFYNSFFFVVKAFLFSMRLV